LINGGGGQKDKAKAGTGVKSLGNCFLYVVPILVGNIIGGSSIVAAIAHAEHIAGGEG